MRRYKASEVTSALALPIVMRALMGSGPNAENRGENTLPFLKRAESRDIELGDAAQQGEHAIAFGDAALRQNVGKPIGVLPQRRIAEIADQVVASNPAQRELVAAARQDMAVDRLMRDVEPAVRKPIKQRARLRPGERAGVCVVVRQVGARILFGPLLDSFPFH